jgi:hypothetical protein
MGSSSNDDIVGKLPGLDKDDAVQQSARAEIFAQFDPNGNGYASLAECEKGCRDIFNLGSDVLPAPVIMRAYQAARGVAQEKDDNKNQSHGHDYVERSEFRLFLVYLKRYLELWHLFAAMDNGSGGTGTSSTSSNHPDRRVSYEEFQTSLPQLQAWGVTVDDPSAQFATIDKNGGGMILFDEFSQWAMAQVVAKEGKD